MFDVATQRTVERLYRDLGYEVPRAPAVVDPRAVPAPSASRPVIVPQGEFATLNSLPGFVSEVVAAIGDRPQPGSALLTISSRPLLAVVPVLPTQEAVLTAGTSAVVQGEGLAVAFESAVRGVERVPASPEGETEVAESRHVAIVPLGDDAPIDLIGSTVTVAISHRPVAEPVTALPIAAMRVGERGEPVVWDVAKGGEVAVQTSASAGGWVQVSGLEVGTKVRIE